MVRSSLLIPFTFFNLSSIISDADAAKIATYVWNEVLDDGVTAKEMMRLMAAVLLGKATGLPNSPVFRSIGDVKDRVSATTDKNGNRSDVTLDDT